MRFFTLYSLLIFSTFSIFEYNFTRFNELKGYEQIHKSNDFSFEWDQGENHISLLNKGEVVWRFNFDKNEDKPYFYPVRTLEGVDLALERPDDHSWHRGLWFSWKYINEVNYWEEDPSTGLAPGRTKILDVMSTLNEDFSARIRVRLEYISDTENHPLMTGNWVILVSKPNEEGDYWIDWDLEFRSLDRDLILDRTVPAKHGGHSWGGYAGLSIRADIFEFDSIEYLTSDGWRISQNFTGYRDSIRWMNLNGDSFSNDESKSAGITFFDSPGNPRFPSTWYIWFEQGSHAFMTPAFLYNAPYELKANEPLKLRYRSLIHSGKDDFDYLEKEFERYKEEN